MAGSHNRRRRASSVVPGPVCPDDDDGRPATAVVASSEEASTPLAMLLSAWQGTGSVAAFERLVAAARAVAEPVAVGTLRRRGIRDPLAIDEAIALVLDHLRRLACDPGVSRPVMPFEPRPADSAGPPTDSGLAYIVCLARRRALDVARHRLRQARRAVVFSQLEPSDSRWLHDHGAAATPAPGADPFPADLLSRLHETLPHLPSRERLVVELLLAGKSQTVIAHLLDVCEGTVSRLRTKAVASLRLLLAE